MTNQSNDQNNARLDLASQLGLTSLVETARARLNEFDTKEVEEIVTTSDGSLYDLVIYSK